VLSALDRKIGEEVNCPGCGALIVVPETDTVPAPPRAAASELTAPMPAQASAAAGHWTNPQAADRVGGVYVSRRVVYAQAVLLAVAAAGAFVAGYFIGTAGDPPPAVPQGTPSIAVSGRVTLATGDGGDASRGDAGAAVLILPVDRQPRRDAKLEADELNPRQPLPPSGDRILSVIESLGGAYARCDRTGNFRVSLPEPGKYHVLVLSNALEGDGGTPDRVDLATLGEYVFDALRLVANQRYVLATRELTDGDRFDYEFRL
jgi:hypothetical protein